MRSVADDLQQKTQDQVSSSPWRNAWALAFELGEADLEIFCQTQGLDRSNGIRLLQRRRQAGRRPSRCMTEIIG